MGIYRVPPPHNEPIRNYAPGSPERKAIETALAELKSQTIDIPMIINGKEIRSGKKTPIKSPHNIALTLGHYYLGGESEINSAIRLLWPLKMIGPICLGNTVRRFFLKRQNCLQGSIAML